MTDANTTVFSDATRAIGEPVIELEHVDKFFDGFQALKDINLKVGKHELVAFFTGKGTHERDYKRGATLTFEKGIGAKYLELQISDRIRKQQPEFVIKEWE